MPYNWRWPWFTYVDWPAQKLIKTLNHHSCHWLLLEHAQGLIDEQGSAQLAQDSSKLLKVPKFKLTVWRTFYEVAPALGQLLQYCAHVVLRCFVFFTAWPLPSWFKVSELQVWALATIFEARKWDLLVKYTSSSRMSKLERSVLMSETRPGSCSCAQLV
jgi:hypothetical protein